jgi:alkylated DNA repair dioxygenase AlkB
MNTEYTFTAITDEISMWDAVFTTNECRFFFEHCFSLNTLHQGEIKLFGKRVPVPRLESFHCNEAINYTYSGKLLNAAPFTPELLEIKTKVERLTGHSFNCVLINVYRNGQDSNGWHADNEKELGKNPIIASVSFGSTRTFKLRSTEGTEQYSIPLTAGSLLLMGQQVQHQFKHCIPKEPKITEPRVNLTFRTILELR